MISYKYWIFYLLPQYLDKFENDLPLIVNTDTYIYAYTDNKDYADIFEEMHNMRYFKRKRFDMTRDQVHELTLSERNKFMKLQSYSTKFSKGVKNVDLVVTLEERYAVEESVRDSIMKCSLKTHLENPDLFSDEIRHALKCLHYTDFWSYQSGELIGSPFESMTFSVSMDELSVYTKLFGMLLKEGDV